MLGFIFTAITSFFLGMICQCIIVLKYFKNSKGEWLQMIDKEEIEAIKEAKEQIEKHHNWNNINCFMTDTTTLKTLINLIEKQEAEINRLQEISKEHQKINGELREQLQMFIPRRRVRRVYKMLGKILRTDIPPELLEKELKK